MSKFQQRHYEALAEIFQRVSNHNPQDEDVAMGWHAAVSALRVNMADMFKYDNAMFDTGRFERACQPGANVKARVR